MYNEIPTDNPVVPGAILAADDLPERFRDSYALKENFSHGADLARHIPIRYADAVPDVPEVVAWVKELVGEAKARRTHTPGIYEGRSLLLVGGTGSGKTYQAYGAVRALSASGARCTWIVTTAADLYAALRPRHRVDAEEEFERYARPSVLVLDDLGAAKGTEWNEEINYRLINYRYERAKPTIVTTNVLPKNMQAALGERVASRLIEMTDRVVIKGSDRRLAGTATLRVAP